jgi:hypothetical protein
MQRFAAAEPVLIAAYNALPADSGFGERLKVTETLIQLYQEWGKQDEAKAWRKRRLASATAPVSLPMKTTSSAPATAVH